MKQTKYLFRFTALLLCVFLAAVSCSKNDPSVLEYEGFTFTAEQESLSIETGSSDMISGKLIAASGLNLIHIKTGAWTAGGQVSEQTVEVYGSPKTYNFSFEVAVPYDAAQDNQVELVFEDYKGEKLSRTIPVAVGKDQVPPVVTVNKPTDDDKVFSPEEKVPFDIKVTDEKRLGKAILSCEAIGFSKNYTPARPDDKFINIADELLIPDLGDYTFLLEAYDAQGNRTARNIEVQIKESSKPAIVNQMTSPILGVAGGTMPFSFRVSTDIEHVIAEITVKIASNDVTTSRTLTPNRQIVDLEDFLEIPASADAHDNDLAITVTAKNDIGESSQWSGLSSIVKGMYVTGNATIGKDNAGYSMPMTQTAGSNTFTFKTYAESAGDGLTFWSGAVTKDDQYKPTAKRIFSWGKGSGDNIAMGSATPVAIPARGYYVVTVDPVAGTCSVAADTNVPSNGNPVWAQINDAKRYQNGEWKTLSWAWTQFDQFPDNPHRYYIDLKTAGGNAWERVVIGLSGQGGSSGIIYGIPTGGGYKYAFDGWASGLEIKSVWNEAGKLSEKGQLPVGTTFRMVVDTYLLQVGWAPIEKYTYPAPAAQ